MNLYVTKNYEELSELAANFVLSSMLKAGRVNLSITGGKTPKRMYELLVPKVKDREYYNNVHYYNFDEIPVAGKEVGLTIRDLSNMYFNPANINKENIHVLNEKNYHNYDEVIEKDGGIDMVIIGIGLDGHFCGNLPGTCTFADKTHKVNSNISEKIYDRIKFLVGGKDEDVSEYYVTMGPRTIMNIKHIILIANGKEKAEIVNRSLYGEISEDCPSSILQLHPNLTVILDEEAASLLQDIKK